jgi:hypothetical protein
LTCNPYDREVTDTLRVILEIGKKRRVVAGAASLAR